jgi:hypothetical protein
MPTSAPVVVVKGLPGYDSIKQIAERFAASKGAILASTNTAAIVHARAIIENHPEGRYKYEDSDIEIMGVGELARIFCEFTDAPLLPVASTEVQTAIASIAASSLPRGSAYYESRELPGFHEALASTLQELRRWRKTPSMLSRLRPKVAEIGELFQAFESALADQRMTTLSHRIEGIVSSEPKKPNGLKHVFWIGETEWPPLMIDLISWMAAAGVAVTVLVEHHPSNHDFYFASNELLANLPQAKVETLRQQAPEHANVYGEQNLVESNVRLIRMPDPVVECEQAVSNVYGSKSVVYCRSPQEYAPYLHAAADRVGIALSIERQEPLLDNPFARHFLDAVIACAEGSIEAVASLAMSSYSGVPHRDRAQVRSTIRKALRSDSPWEELESGIESVPSWVSMLAEWRRTARESDKTLADWSLQLKQLTAKMPWIDVSLDRDSATRVRDESAQDAMIRSFEISKITAEPKRRLSLHEFAKHLDAIWRSTECWVRSNGDVRVVRSPFEIGNVDSVFAIGLIEGRFPKRRAEDPLLLDADRRELGLPDSYSKSEQERLEFHRLACQANELYFSYPETFAETEQVESAFLDDIGGDWEYVELEQRFPKPDRAKFTVDLLAAEAWYDEAPNQSIAAPERERIERAVENSRIPVVEDPAVAESLRKLPNPLFAGHLRSLARCPFQYLCTAKFGLRQQRPRSVWDHLATVVRRTNLGDCANSEDLKTKLQAGLQTLIEELRGSATEDELVLLRVAGSTALDAFAEREFAAREVWGTMPAQQDLRLHEAGFRTIIPGPSGEVRLDETIDVLYRRGQDVMPMRLGIVASSTNEDRLLEDVALLYVLNDKIDKDRMAAIDSLETGVRLAVSCGRGGNKSTLRSMLHKGIKVVEPDEGERETLRGVAAYIKQQISRAVSGNFLPQPGEHCERCSFAPLCRSARYSKLLADVAEETA